MIRCSIGLIIICMLFGRPSLAADLPLPRTPIYDSHSQSYFQLFGDNVHPGNWEAARIRAAQKFYTGVQGRLAVFARAATHAFLLRPSKVDGLSGAVGKRGFVGVD